MMFERTCSKWWLLTYLGPADKDGRTFFFNWPISSHVSQCFVAFFGPHSYLRRLFWCHFKSFKTTLTGGVEFPVAL